MRRTRHCWTAALALVASLAAVPAAAQSALGLARETAGLALLGRDVVLGGCDLEAVRSFSAMMGYVNKTHHYAAEVTDDELVKPFRNGRGCRPIRISVSRYDGPQGDAVVSIGGLTRNGCTALAYQVQSLLVGRTRWTKAGGMPYGDQTGITPLRAMCFLNHNVSFALKGERD